MMRRYLTFVLLTVAAVSAACSGGGNPAQPSISTSASAAPAPESAGTFDPLTSSVTVPRLFQPANNAAISYFTQPLTLIVQNAVVTSKTGATTYTFEVATDANFASKVQTKDGVTEDSGGLTGVRLDTLAPSRDYWWHVRAVGGGTTGLFTAAYKFTMGPNVILNAPTPIAPLTNAQTSVRPALRVTNATRVGPAGPLTYRFEVSSTANFASIVATGTVAEGVNETGFIPSTDLPIGPTLFWRATAIDATNSITSAASSVQSFTVIRSQAEIVAAQLGVPLWPRAVPPGNVGHATMGMDWVVEPIVSFTGVRFINPPIDELQIFDLLDRGFTPQDAIDWMHANGYTTIGVWYPAVQVIGFEWEYMAYIGGVWDIVIRNGA